MKYIVGNDTKYLINQNDCYFSIICRLYDNIKKLHKTDIQNKRGVYIFWDWNDKPIRIGKGAKIRNRLLQYYTQYQMSYLWENMHQEIQFVSAIYTQNEKQSLMIELDLIQYHKPKYNCHNKK